MEEKRRIFCVITQGGLGGAQQFVIQLARYLNVDKFDLHIVWGSDSGTAIGRHLPSHVTYSAARHLLRSVSPISDLRAVWELRAMMVHYRPDVILCISSKAGFIASLAARIAQSQLRQTKVIYRIGGWTFNDPWPAWKRKGYLWLERLSARWKDYIVVNNTHDLDQARTLGIRPRSKVVRIYNGIEPYLDLLPRDQALAALRSRMPERYRDKPYDWMIGTVANLYPAKDLSTLVRAAELAPKNVRFIVIGEGHQRAELERQIIECDLSDRFFLLGGMNEAYKYLSALDVFVLSSVKEGFPWSVLEAMTAKVPVISTSVGAIPEMIENHISGILVQPGSSDQIAGAIMELLDNDRLRRELAIQAHQQVITQFSLRAMIDQYERLLSI
jgi:glycosyltransferase involved in cell wall biosynthesis